jgi:uncharacterized protein (DUF433 family)
MASAHSKDTAMQQTFEAVTVPLEYNEQDVIRISGTRVSLDSVLHAYNEGATPEEIVYRFPTLKLDDLYAVISYALRHPKRIADYLNRQQAKQAQLRDQLASQFPADDLRARLLARRAIAEQNSGA